MSEKTEEQIAKDKANVSAMRNAQSAMASVLNRNADLEHALVSARDALVRTKQYVAANCYAWKTDGRDQQTVHAVIDTWVEGANKVLGA